MIQHMVKEETKKLEVEIETLTNKLHKLEKENRFLQLTFEHANDAIILFNENVEFFQVNQKACELFELSREGLLGRKLHDFLDLMSKEEVEFQEAQLDELGELKNELVVRLDNGTIKYVEYSAVRNPDESGLDICIIRDITAKKKLEKESNKSKQMYHDVINRAVDGIVVFDKEGYFIDVNPAFCSNFAMPKLDLLQSKLDDFVEEDFQYKMKKIWSLLDNHGRVRGELPVILHTGERKTFEVTITANIYDDYYLAIMRDVTEKRNMELQLQKSEERFREMFQHALDAIVLVDNSGEIMRANPAASRAFELPLDELIHSKLHCFVPRHSKRVFSIMKQFVANGEIREELEFHMPNGQKKLLEFTANKGIIDGFNMIIFRNVSERRKMEKDLRESEQKFRKIFDNAMDGILLWDNKCNIIDANPNASKILKLPKEELVANYLHYYLQHEQFQDLQSHWKDCPNSEELSGEVCLEDETGMQIIEYSAKKNVIEGLHMTIFRNITEKREMEDQLRKSDTLTVVGELAAGIAHEIRNPMTALKGFIQLLQNSMNEDQYAMYFDVITSELKRIESIITEFLVLAKPQAISYQRKSVTVIMKETLDLLSAQASLDNVQFVTSIEEGLPDIYCEPNQLKQVFINILKNAIEVMPKGGTASVALSKEDGEQVLISIRDEGIGIPEDKLKKLGEPFYTTKDRGTGLGLMVSYKIVEEHNGTIEVSSELGKGTTFHIRLPIGTPTVH
ncbi:PAS domain-containing sensor histidine kinase [Sutcliffiella horikoshii]|uniref:PAS domain-containing sensor histidine kinase n=1 Tax=Sutcliffiella horikoshii TaxID=79883 RepID=UPI001F16665A|nr:PAS domain-containing sensor histidine kinase [Sutcliffiella horikoshii]MCG1020227.1 PAS domain-containing sensor histidine kinase [Sutcliffiella horikoshii]